MRGLHRMDKPAPISSTVNQSISLSVGAGAVLGKRTTFRNRRRRLVGLRFTGETKARQIRQSASRRSASAIDGADRHVLRDCVH